MDASEIDKILIFGIWVDTIPLKRSNLTVFIDHRNRVCYDSDDASEIVIFLIFGIRVDTITTPRSNCIF